jgi:hypothetical protein
MNTIKNTTKRVRFFTGTFLACLGLLVIGVGFTAPNNISFHQDRQVVIESLTPALAAVKSEYDGRTINLVVKNTSSKKITAYAVSVNDTFVSNRDFVYSVSGGLAPREDSTHILSVDGSMQNKTVTVKLLSVIFEDKSKDGDNKTASEIVERRKAEKSQLIRLLPKLQKALESGDDELPATISETKRDILSLPTSLEEQATSDSGNSGMKYGKQDVINKLSYLEKLSNSSNKATLREQAQKIIDNYQRVISRL